MIRVLMTVIALFSFALNAVADDSCCFKQESSCSSTHAQIQGDHSRQLDPMDHPEVCINCVRCGLGVTLPLPNSVPAVVSIDSGAIGYVPMFAPSPDVLGLLRPPIA